MNQNQFLTCWLLILISLRPFSQNAYQDLLNANYTYLTPAGLGDSTNLLNQESYQFSGSYGWELKGGQSQFGLGFSYERLELSDHFNLAQPLGINNVGLGAEYRKQWKNPKWGSTIQGGINGSSDNEFIASTAYQTQLLAMFHYGKSNRLIWTFGMLHSFQPFGNWFFPVLGVDWQITERLYFNSILFSETYLEYELKKNKFYCGLISKSQDYSFVLNDFQGMENTFLTSFGETFPYYPYNRMLFMDFYFKQYYVLFFNLGVQHARGFLHATAEGNEIGTSIFNSSISNAGVIKIGAALRIRNN